MTAIARALVPRGAKREELMVPRNPRMTLKKGEAANIERGIQQ